MKRTGEVVFLLNLLATTRSRRLGPGAARPPARQHDDSSYPISFLIYLSNRFLFLVLYDMDYRMSFNTTNDCGALYSSPSKSPLSSLSNYTLILVFIPPRGSLLPRPQKPLFKNTPSISSFIHLHLPTQFPAGSNSPQHPPSLHTSLKTGHVYHALFVLFSSVLHCNDISLDSN